MTSCTFPRLVEVRAWSVLSELQSLAELSPYAMHVWEEAAGPYKMASTWRLFALSTSLVLWWKGERKLDLDESVTSIAAQRGIDIKEQWDKEVKRELRSAKKAFKAMRKDPD